MSQHEEDKYKSINSLLRKVSSYIYKKTPEQITTHTLLSSFTELYKAISLCIPEEHYNFYPSLHATLNLMNNMHHLDFSSTSLKFGERIYRDSFARFNYIIAFHMSNNYYEWNVRYDLIKQPTLKQLCRKNSISKNIYSLCNNFYAALEGFVQKQEAALAWAQLQHVIEIIIIHLNSVRQNKSIVYQQDINLSKIFENTLVMVTEFTAQFGFVRLQYNKKTMQILPTFPKLTLNETRPYCSKLLNRIIVENLGVD